MSYADGLLATGERILRRERQHWMFPLLVAGRWVAIAILIGVVGALIVLLLNPSGQGGLIDNTVGLVQTIVGILTTLAIAFAIVGLVWSAIRWRSQEYVLTDRRVMHIYGVINKQALDSSLENITDAQIVVPWLGRIMGFGNLTLMTPAESGINELRLLREPIAFKKDMMDAKHQRLVDINTPRVPAPPLKAPVPEPVAAVAPASTSVSPVAPPPPAATPRVPLELDGEADGWLGGPVAATADTEPVEVTPDVPAPVTAPPAGQPAVPTPAEPAAPSAQAAEPSSQDVTRTLGALADLRDRGAITPEEYEAKKQELLGRI